MKWTLFILFQIERILIREWELVERKKEKKQKEVGTGRGNKMNKKKSFECSLIIEKYCS